MIREARDEEEGSAARVVVMVLGLAFWTMVAAFGSSEGRKRVSGLRWFVSL